LQCPELWSCAKLAALVLPECAGCWSPNEAAWSPFTLLKHAHDPPQNMPDRWRRGT
jgi:hypothetical protein